MGTPPLPASLKGMLLLADPSMECAIFEKSVILVTGHSGTKGATGFILNNPLGKSLAKEFQYDPDIAPGISNIPVFRGGPVQDDKLTLLAFSKQEDLFLYKHAVTKTEAKSILQMPTSTVHCFIGNAAWTPGQLEKEIEEGTWLVLPALAQLFDMVHDHTLWEQILRRTSPILSLLSRAPKRSFLN